MADRRNPFGWRATLENLETASARCGPASRWPARDGLPALLSANEGVRAFVLADRSFEGAAYRLASGGTAVARRRLGQRPSHNLLCRLLLRRFALLRSKPRKIETRTVALPHHWAVGNFSASTAAGTSLLYGRAPVRIVQRPAALDLRDRNTGIGFPAPPRCEIRVLRPLRVSRLSALRKGRLAQVHSGGQHKGCPLTIFDRLLVLGNDTHRAQHVLKEHTFLRLRTRREGSYKKTN